jgi:hypothetical protein
MKLSKDVEKNFKESKSSAEFARKCQSMSPAFARQVYRFLKKQNNSADNHSATEKEN